ncbi:MAG TPA: ABC transporter permease [Conexibacter sp.]|jgi:peptide/nickel transport system permease protein|nr:ABC transporter permease [Conexibacter sp.]
MSVHQLTHRLRRPLRIDRRVAIPLGFLVLLAIVALLAPLLPGIDPTTQNPVDKLLPPSLAHPMGTDELGRGVLDRVIVGARVSLAVALGSVVLGGLLGSAIGIVAGYRGGWTDEVSMRSMDVVLAFPAIILALAVVSVAGSSLLNVIVVLAIVQLPVFARLARSVVLGQVSSDYVAAAQSIGSTTPGILTRHIVPNTMAPVLSMAGLMAAGAILNEAALSFLGLGVTPPTPTWGNMLADGSNFMLVGAWWLTVFPGLAMFVTVLAFNVLADAARDLADPTTRTR